MATAPTHTFRVVGGWMATQPGALGGATQGRGSPRRLQGEGVSQGEFEWSGGTGGPLPEVVVGPYLRLSGGGGAT